MEEVENTSMTTAKTLWTETILDILYLALKYDKPDKDISELLKQLRMKGCKPLYIVKKTRQKLGEGAASRVRALMQK